MSRILVVDDDEMVRSMLQKTLEREGYEVTVAANGREAISLVRNRSIDLLITDIIMPDSEGLDLIRETGRVAPEMKIIAISGGGLIEANVYLDLAEMFTADYCFEKPVDRKLMLKAVYELLKDEHASAADRTGIKGAVDFNGDEEVVT